MDLLSREAASLDSKSIMSVFLSRSSFSPQKDRSKASGHQNVSASRCASMMAFFLSEGWSDVLKWNLSH